jgi:hypothetical protein
MPALPLQLVADLGPAPQLLTLAIGTSTLAGGAAPTVTVRDVAAAGDPGVFWTDGSSVWANIGTGWQSLYAALSDGTSTVDPLRSLTVSGATVADLGSGAASLVVDSQIVKIITGDGDIYLAPTASVSGNGSAEISTNAGVGGTGTANVSAECSVGTGNAYANMSAGVLTGDGNAETFLSAQVKNPVTGLARTGIRASRGDGGTLVETAVLIAVGAASESLSIKIDNQTGSAAQVLTAQGDGTALWADVPASITAAMVGARVALGV